MKFNKKNRKAENHDISKNTVEYQFKPGFYVQMTPEQDEAQRNFVQNWYKEQGEIKRKKKEAFENKWASLRMATC